MTLYDVAIVGAGPAGLTAGIYTGRSLLKTVIIEKGPAGGLMALTDKLDNWPGLPGVEGGELSEIMLKQAESFGCELKIGDVAEINKDADGFFTVALSHDEGIRAKAVIYASGSTPRKIGVKGEMEFIGRGVSYCAVCDAAFYRNLRVAVVGGGDSAIKEALYLTKFAKEVVIIHRRQGFRAEKITMEEAHKNEKISFMTDAIVEEIAGTQFVEKLQIKNVKTNEVTEHPFDGAFIFVGYDPQVEPIKHFVTLTEQNFIVADSHMKTNIEGLFAAGDIVDKLIRQVATAVGDGATAGTATEHYIAALGQS
ncbi:thioredoxin-disulfide reductase [bacterium]|nr:thioredoxin-disulfide reductase [bacterium]